MKIPVPAWLGLLAIAAAAGDVSPLQRPNTLLVLHYRWKHDSLTLIESDRIPAKVKVSRLSPVRRALLQADAATVPRSPFSYELMGANGKSLATRYLQDPGLRRVEYQEQGERTMRVQEEKLDSADIFLRIPEADAQSIRFYRHTPALPVKAGANAKATPKTTAPGASVIQGPQPLPAKTLLAEFPLP